MSPTGGPARFELGATLGKARAGRLHLTRGGVDTPAFMPVGTRGTVRGVAPDELRAVGTQLLLANTYHLWVRPGHEVVRDVGGLPAFSAWNGPMLTDSGGYQVFSLRDRTVVGEQGVRVRSPEDGVWRELGPEVAIEVQEALGVDVAMAFDECLEHPADRDRAATSTARTTRWLRRCIAARRHPDRTALFGIVQGGMHDDLRFAHAQEIAALELDGYAIGGLSVGESREDLVRLAELSADGLPANKVRYLMGVGHPVDIADAVIRGVDLFDCVLPTRGGRHGQAYTSAGRRNLKNARYRADAGALDPACDCATCRTYSRAFLRHLVVADEQLGKRALTVHNLAFYHRLMAELRGAVLAGDGARLAAAREGAARASRLAAD